MSSNQSRRKRLFVLLCVLCLFAYGGFHSSTSTSAFTLFQGKPITKRFHLIKSTFEAWVPLTWQPNEHPGPYHTHETEEWNMNELRKAKRM
jgi:hypothetical protein